jgi:hypothetical protein
MTQSILPSQKPTASPFWKWLMRLTAIFALALFLVPTVYVIKYYALDLPRETALAQPHQLFWRQDPHNPDDLLAEAETAKEPIVQRVLPAQLYRITAIREMGETLLRPGIGWKRPLECLTAKATLADLAVHAPDPAVRAAASEELGKVAQNGAVIRR